MVTHSYNKKLLLTVNTGEIVQYQCDLAYLGDESE